jgi:hypothetical protein
LPNINHNLWKRYSSDKNGAPRDPNNNNNNNNNSPNPDVKKKQVFDLIDAYATNRNGTMGSQQEFEQAVLNHSNSFYYGPEKRSKHPEHRYDPVTRDHIRPETYWNDW